MDVSYTFNERFAILNKSYFEMYEQDQLEFPSVTSTTLRNRITSRIAWSFT